MSMAMSLPVRADGSWLDSINPMNLFKGEKYEPKVVPDVRAEDLYNQRARPAAKQGLRRRSQEIRRSRQAIFPIAMAKEGVLMTIFSQYQNASYDDAINSAKRYIKLFPNAPDLPYAYILRNVLLQSNPGHKPRSGPRGQGG